MKLTRRNRIVLISVCVLMLSLGGGWWLFSGSDDLSKVEVHGNLSKQDVAAINAAVKRQMWREALPNFSWKSIRQFPAGAKRCFDYRLAVISASASASDATVRLTMRKNNSNDPSMPTLIYPFYRVERQTNGWKARLGTIYF